MVDVLLDSEGRRWRRGSHRLEQQYSVVAELQHNNDISTAQVNRSQLMLPPLLASPAAACVCWLSDVSLITGTLVRMIRRDRRMQTVHFAVEHLRYVVAVVIPVGCTQHSSTHAQYRSSWLKWASGRSFAVRVCEFEYGPPSASESAAKAARTTLWMDDVSDADEADMLYAAI